MKADFSIGNVRRGTIEIKHAGIGTFVAERDSENLASAFLYRLAFALKYEDFNLETYPKTLNGDLLLLLLRENGIVNSNDVRKLLLGDPAEFTLNKLLSIALVKP